MICCTKTQKSPRGLDFTGLWDFFKFCLRMLLFLSFLPFTRIVFRARYAVELLYFVHPDLIRNCRKITAAAYSGKNREIQ